jgi:acyl carrier protein
MDNQELLNSIRKIFAKVVSQDRTNLIYILNKNGFPTSSAVSNDDLILDSLKALQLSKNFEDDLVGLMAKYQEMLPNVPAKKNFAAQDLNVVTLGPQNLGSSVNSLPDNLFLNAPLFIDNCNNCKSFN